MGSVRMDSTAAAENRRKRCKEEINFIRLLNRTELMAQNLQCPSDGTTDGAGDVDDGLAWRYPIWVKTLTGDLESLSGRAEAAGLPVSDEDLQSYRMRLMVLQRYQRAREEQDPVEQLETTQQISTTPSNPYRSPVPQQLKAKGEALLRQELFRRTDGSSSDPTDQTAVVGDTVDSADGLRMRQKQKQKEMPHLDADTVLRYHRRMHDSITTEIGHLAKQLKENTLASRRLLQEDGRNLKSSDVQVDRNIGNLQIESQRIEVEARRWCSWWIWLMVIIVVVTFVWLNIIMRIFKKPAQ